MHLNHRLDLAGFVFCPNQTEFGVIFQRGRSSRSSVHVELKRGWTLLTVTRVGEMKYF